MTITDCEAARFKVPPPNCPSFALREVLANPHVRERRHGPDRIRPARTLAKSSACTLRQPDPGLLRVGRFAAPTTPHHVASWAPVRRLSGPASGGASAKHQIGP
jgi:hypothetical protein